MWKKKYTVSGLTYQDIANMNLSLQGFKISIKYLIKKQNMTYCTILLFI